jgi:hypothetical protein
MFDVMTLSKPRLAQHAFPVPPAPAPPGFDLYCTATGSTAHLACLATPSRDVDATERRG